MHSQSVTIARIARASWKCLRMVSTRLRLFIQANIFDDIIREYFFPHFLACLAAEFECPSRLCRTARTQLSGRNVAILRPTFGGQVLNNPSDFLNHLAEIYFATPGLDV
jgi:hypothetical protein